MDHSDGLPQWLVAILQETASQPLLVDLHRQGSKCYLVIMML